jgi:predicted DNA-binding protein (MmcQ/YjbR family)
MPPLSYPVSVVADMAMTWRQLKAHCLSLEGAQETFPFGPDVSVFKASNGKVFALSMADAEPLTVSVKVEPEEGELLRSTYDAVEPGYHLNKKHWVTVALGADAPDALVRDLISDSHALVAPKRR